MDGSPTPGSTVPARLMERTGYPGLRQHQREHDDLRSRVRAMRDCAASGEATVTVEVMLFLMEWLKRHAAASDRRIGKYLEAGSESEPRP